MFIRYEMDFDIIKEHKILFYLLFLYKIIHVAKKMWYNIDNTQFSDRGKQPMRYHLRYAAGIYWLLDTWQEGVPYKRPLVMNEVGADIWRMIEQGYSREQIVDGLCQEYQMDREVVVQDFEQFLAQLAEFGIEENGESKMAGNSGKEGV